MALDIPSPKKRHFLRSKKITAGLTAAGALYGAGYLLYRAISSTNFDVLRAAAKRLATIVIRQGGAARTKPQICKMPETITTAEQYWESLRDSWGYTMEQARNHIPMRMSSVAIPVVDSIGQDARVLGVLYCDSSDREFFDAEIVELCGLAALALSAQLRLAS